jgi:hypothetical protein
MAEGFINPTLLEGAILGILPQILNMSKRPNAGYISLQFS